MNKKGFDQLVDYLEAKGLKQGYMLSFSRNEKKTAGRSLDFVSGTRNF